MTDETLPIEERDTPGRSEWTPKEVAQVRERFGPEDADEALDLFAPNEWITYYEEATDEEFVGERNYLRRGRARWLAGAEMGFSPGEIALMGAVGNALADRADS